MMKKWLNRGCLLVVLINVAGCSSFTTRGLHYISPDFTTDSKYPRTILEVSTLTPTFQWESIKDYLQRKGGSKEDIVNITKSLYDIKIFPVAQWHPGEVNRISGEYEKFNLTTTSHTLEQALHPDESYVVMIRGFYQVGNEQRLVPWSKLRGSYSEWEHILHLKAFVLFGAPSGIGSYPYIFKTPGNGTN